VQIAESMLRRELISLDSSSSLSWLDEIVRNVGCVSFR